MRRREWGSWRRFSHVVAPWAREMASQCAGGIECVELAALAFWESRLSPFVLRGDCESSASGRRRRAGRPGRRRAATRSAGLPPTPRHGSLRSTVDEETPTAPPRWPKGRRGGSLFGASAHPFVAAFEALRGHCDGQPPIFAIPPPIVAAFEALRGHCDGGRQVVVVEAPLAVAAFEALRGHCDAPIECRPDGLSKVAAFEALRGHCDRPWPAPSSSKRYVAAFEALRGHCDARLDRPKLGGYGGSQRSRPCAAIATRALAELAARDGVVAAFEALRGHCDRHWLDCFVLRAGVAAFEALRGHCDRAAAPRKATP
jgi:hypothetical protein